MSQALAFRPQRPSVPSSTHILAGGVCSFKDSHSQVLAGEGRPHVPCSPRLPNCHSKQPRHQSCPSISASSSHTWTPTPIDNQRLPSISPQGIRSQGRGKARDRQGMETQPQKGSSNREPPVTCIQSRDHKKQAELREGLQIPS